MPREVEFLDELPRNATGKVLKRELEERSEEDGASSDGKSSSSRSRSKPKAKSKS